MNFLAHAWLAEHAAAGRGERERAGLIVGGVIGDWIKGPLDRSGLPADLRRGVELHRAIDTFAETQSGFMRSRARMPPERRRWSGVLVDMFYDHLLARDWPAWHPEPLGEFTARTYTMLAGQLNDCPPGARPALGLMIREDWLDSYASRDGLLDVLNRMSRRARQPNPLAEGIVDLDREGAGLSEDFGLFVADAVPFVRSWIERRTTAPPGHATRP